MSREIKFRAWSGTHNHMFRVSEISQRRDGYTHGLIDEGFKDEFTPEFDHKFAFVGRVNFTTPSDGKNAGIDQRENDENFILMQYTGLKDDNGKEIYEGDIVKVVDSEGSMEMPDTGIGVVEWFNDWAFYNVTEIENGLGELVHGMHVEVIGNIYEHSHLLEVAK